MMVPLMKNGQIVEILDSKDLTPAEWARVKADKSGALRERDS